MAVDAAEFVLDLLQATTAVTDLLMDGASSIYESGDLDMKLLAATEKARRDAGTPTLALALVVQDAGENPETDQRNEQRVAVWIYDRQRGYRNIRALRKQVYLAVNDKSAGLSDPLTDRTIMLRLTFGGRTGHRHEARNELDFEVITWTTPVYLELG